MASGVLEPQQRRQQPELSEEGIAEGEQEGTETAGEIGRKAWENVVAFELDTLRAAGRDAGLTGVVEWFDRHGLRFDLSATGVHRGPTTCRPGGSPSASTVPSRRLAGA